MDERSQGRPSLFIPTILIALPSGVTKTFLDIRQLFDVPVEIGLCQSSVDTLIWLAVVEVFKATWTYFSEGRINVTFLDDTILMVMLTEINLLECKDADHMKVLVLGAIRVVAVPRPMERVTAGGAAGRGESYDGLENRPDVSVQLERGGSNRPARTENRVVCGTRGRIRLGESRQHDDTRFRRRSRSIPPNDRPSFGCRQWSLIVTGEPERHGAVAH